MLQKTPPKLRFKPKMRKIVELLLYLSHKAQHIDHYKACKLVYLADWMHLNKKGRPIAADVPVAMPFGPVATKSLDILKGKASAWREAGIKELPFETKQLDKIIYIGAPKRPVNHELFSRSDLEIFDEVLREYGGMTFDQLHDVTSKHFAYRSAWSGRPNKEAKSAPMRFDDMLEESAERTDYMNDIEMLSHKM